MWQLFKEFVWDKGWGKLFSLVGFLSTIWSVILMTAPDVYNKVPQSFRIDSRIWYGFTILLLILALIFVLRGASEYKKRLEVGDNLRMVYMARRYPACRDIVNDEEIFRIGLRSKGTQPIDNPTVIPFSFYRVNNKKYVKISVMQIPLSPMVGTVNRVMVGFMPAYYVNLFKHKLGGADIVFCYDHYESKPLSLSKGKYILTLVARGTPNEENAKTWIIKLNKKNEIDMELERGNY
jgi:hypothetical protein